MMFFVLFAATLLQQAPAAAPATGSPAAAKPVPLFASGSRAVTRRFTPLSDGGVFEVIMGDRGRVPTARKRLREDAERFANGNFRHPVLSAAASRIDVAYADTEAGGRIRFMTADPRLVQSLHAWLAAQARS